MFLSKTIFEHLNSWLPFSNRFHEEFRRISDIKHRPEDSRARPNEFYNLAILEDSEQTFISREVETLVDVMGDLGGLIEIIVITTAFLMAKF